MMRHWQYVVSGILFMIGFAVFSGISVTMVVPVIDSVFRNPDSQFEYHEFSQLKHEILDEVSSFWGELGSKSDLLKESTYKNLDKRIKAVLNKTAPMLLLWTISIFMLCLIILKNIFFYLNKLMFVNLRGLTVLDIRKEMYTKYLNQSLAFFSENKVGDAMVRLVSDVANISNIFLEHFFEIIRDAILMIIYIFMALMINHKLFIYSVIILPWFSLAVSFTGKKIKKYSKKIQIQNSNMFSRVEEVLNNIRIVKAFAKEKFELSKFQQINLNHFMYWRKSVIYQAYSVPLSELSSTLTGMIVLLIGGNAVLTGEMSFGFFLAFLFAIFSMLHPMKTLTRNYAAIKRAIVSIDRVYEVLDHTCEITEDPEAVEKKSFDSHITFKDVIFSYKNGENVIHNLNLIIRKGEKIALVGSSGAGKTTIINLLTRMYDITSGDIEIDNVSIKHMKLHDLRKLFGTVTQESILFSETIFNNIAYGLDCEEVNEKTIMNSADIAYADEFINRFPKKYNENLTARASNISGGQRQRICIARAIADNPPILILDEATSALDTESEKKVQQAIEKAASNRTVIIIAHRLSTVLSADRIYVMDKGEVICSGHHSELINTCERYRYLYNIQFE